jgi:hypothetical protein
MAVLRLEKSAEVCMIVIAIILSIASLIVAPYWASKALGLRGGLGKAAMVGLVSLGLMQIIGMVAQYLGPLGDTLALMGGLAAWFQVVKVVHGTDTAKTAVFMFWQLFFQILIASVLSLFLGTAAVVGWWV